MGMISTNSMKLKFKIKMTYPSQLYACLHAFSLFSGLFGHYNTQCHLTPISLLTFLHYDCRLHNWNWNSSWIFQIQLCNLQS